MEAFGTDRLILREWTHDEPDVARMLDTYRQWEVARWLGATPSPMADLDQAHSTVDRWRARSAAPCGVWAVQVRASGTVAGTVLLVPLPDSPAGEVEVGWHLHPDSWGHGYATEAARAVLARGFAAGLSEIYAVVRPDNAPSLAVCGRLGLTPIGRTDRWYGTELEAFRATSP